MELTPFTIIIIIANSERTADGGLTGGQQGVSGLGKAV